MEKVKSKSTKSIIIAIALTLSIVILSANIYSLIVKENDTVELNRNLQEKYEKLNTEITNSNDKIKEINNKLIEIKNIDSNMEDIKIDLFKNIEKLESAISSKKNNSKIAYLTFDDGPYYLTYSYLKVLKKYDVKATFFTIGSGKTRCYDKKDYDCTLLYKEIVKDGHTIANHTYTHAIFNGLYKNSTSFLNDIDRMNKYIKDMTNISPNIMRFPGGIRTAGNLKQSIISGLRQRKMGYVEWTAADGDGGSLKTKEQAWTNFKNSINSDIEVVLFHDYNSITLSILEDAIKYLEEKGYILLPLFYESIMVNK